jgi:hypothetical protein
MPRQLTIYDCLQDLERMEHENQQMRLWLDELLADLSDMMAPVTATPDDLIPWSPREAED